MKIIVAGPPHSGKSLFINGLKESLKHIGTYPYVFRACPDGEGCWYVPTAEQDKGVADSLRNKSAFSTEFVEWAANSVEKLTLPLSLVDIGGRVSPENRRICASCTHMILLSGDEQKNAEWLLFAEELGIKVIAIIKSDYLGTEDSFFLREDGVLEGAVHHLERGEPCANRPTIRAMAVNICQKMGE